MSAVAPDVATVMAAAAQAAAFQPRKITPKDRNMYHLKRIMSEVKYSKEQEQRLYNLFKQTKQCTGSSSEAEIRAAYTNSREVLISQATIVLLDRQTRFGRNPEMVDIVLHSDTSGNQMVSRLHAEIHAEVDSKDPSRFLRYYIVDKSLNGTYVNNRRAPVESNKLYLNAGDVIRFGHSNGAAFKPGEYAQTYDSEFSFTFEAAMEDVEYLGHTPDGHRIERKGPKAYMHIGSTSILPHEFDHFSLVPKREPDLSIVPLGMRGNKEQKTAQLYQARTQLVMERAQDDSPILPTNNFSAANIQIPGLSNPAVIPTMSNFDLTSDMSRLFRELQNQNGQTADQINAALLQALFQQQNLSNFYYQPPNPLLANLNALLNQQRISQQMFNPPSNVDFLAALKSLSTPMLTSQGNFLPEFNNGIGQVNAATMAAVTSLTNSAAFQQMSAIRAQQDGSAGPSSSTPASTTSDHNDEVLIAQKKAQAEAEARRNEAAIAAVLKGGSVNNLHPEDRELIMNQATSLRSNDVDGIRKKVDINEFTLKATAEAAEAAAISGKGNFSPPLKSPTVLAKKERKKKVVDGSVPGTSTTRDHVQETIDAVAKRVLESGSGEKEDAEEAEAIIRQQIEMASASERPKKRRNFKKSLDNSGESGKSKETVLKLLDDAKAEMEPLPPKLDDEPTTTNPQVEQIELPEPQPSTAKIESSEVTSIKPINIIITKEPDEEREQTSSVESLIVCEASLDDPALLNPSTINDGNIFENSTKIEIKPSSSENLERRSSAGSKTGLLKRRKDSTSSSDSDSDFNEQIKKVPIKKQLSLIEKRGKKSTSSVKQRIIRVPRSPIPNKKGPERIPGHKSNEVARLLYDLEVLPISGSYMQCQRIGDEKDTRRRNRDSSDDDQPPAILPKRKSADGTRILSIDGRISESPVKKLKDGFIEDINGNISSSDSDDSIKMNGNSKSKKKVEKADKKPKMKKQAEKRKASSSDDSSDSETEPTPRKRKSATIKIKKEEKKPGKTSKKMVEIGKKKRGRKAKNSGDGSVEWEKCAFAGCKHPKVEGTVNWVQCDDCDKWFHIFCAFGREDKSVLEDEFHCGCKRVRSSTNPTNTTAVTA